MGVLDMKVKGQSGICAFGLFIWEIEELVSWHTGMTYTGMSITKRTEDWLLILRIRKKDINYAYFAAGHTRAECYRRAWLDIKNDRLHLKVDKFRK